MDLHISLPDLRRTILTLREALQLHHHGHHRGVLAVPPVPGDDGDGDEEEEEDDDDDDEEDDSDNTGGRNRSGIITNRNNMMMMQKFALEESSVVVAKATMRCLVAMTTRRRRRTAATSTATAAPTVTGGGSAAGGLLVASGGIETGTAMTGRTRLPLMMEEMPWMGRHGFVTDLVGIFDGMIHTRRDDTYEFYKLWQEWIWNLLDLADADANDGSGYDGEILLPDEPATKTSSSSSSSSSSLTPTQLFGWELLERIIDASSRHRPPPRCYRVDGSGCGFVNGLYEYAGPVTREGYGFTEWDHCSHLHDDGCCGCRCRW
jgi:hypothetical protein